MSESRVQEAKWKKDRWSAIKDEVREDDGHFEIDENHKWNDEIRRRSFFNH